MAEQEEEGRKRGGKVAGEKGKENSKKPEIFLSNGEKRKVEGEKLAAGGGEGFSRRMKRGKKGQKS